MYKSLKKINIITLGCYKNLVDSEFLMKQLSANNLIVEHDANNTNAKIVIINTCGFINSAKQESIDTILEFVKAKEKGEIEKIFVIGCLSERYKEKLEKEIPEVAQYFGTNNIKEILQTLGLTYKKELTGKRIITTPKHYAYLKISEGCNRHCSFCAIPLMRGKHISKPIETLIDEAKYLVEKGVKELILIAQDSSYYGIDIYKKPELAKLLEKLSALNGVKWIRLHYAYPSKFPLNVIKVMKERENICKYIDIPLQHISDNMLKVMRRGINKRKILKLIDLFRKEIPDIAIRTTILVGHPGETKNDFEELKQFVKSQRFERLGIFTYSYEEDTYSYQNYKDNIPEKIKQQRADEIMEIQLQISNELNNNKIGKSLKVIIDRCEDDFYIGRTEHDSPEIDNEVLIKIENNNLTTALPPTPPQRGRGNNNAIGNFHNVKITFADDYDLHGVIQLKSKN